MAIDSRLVVRGVSRAPENSSACLVRPDLTGFGGGLRLHCDVEDDGRRDDDGGCGHSVGIQGHRRLAYACGWASLGQGTALPGVDLVTPAGDSVFACNDGPGDRR